jgi:glucose-6-phosphate 1-epimerase
MARFVGCDDELTRNVWPHSFQVTLGVTVGGPALGLDLSVTNSGNAPFEFTAALHTYLLLLADIASVSIEGLRGLRCRDTAAGGVELEQPDADVTFSGQVDRIYHDVPGPLRLHEPGRVSVISQEGFTDAVIWNPGAERAAQIGDLEPGEHHRFVCIEAGAIGRPVTLAAGQGWTGRQTIS